MDPIYSSIKSHHTVSQIDKATGICDFPVIIILLTLIVCWAVWFLYNTNVGSRKKNPSETLIYFLLIGLVVAIAGFLYISQAYGC